MTFLEYLSIVRRRWCYVIAFGWGFSAVSSFGTDVERRSTSCQG